MKTIHECPNRIRDTIVPLYLIRLDGRTRFDLVTPETDSEKLIIGSHLRLLWKEKLEHLNKITKKTFDKYVIPVRNDPSKESYITLRVSTTSPTFELMAERVSRKEEVIHSIFYEECPLITEQGDGIQAFVGILSAILVRPQTIILIDEPEAFLAPSIARVLGRELTKIAQERNASLIVSTHSADFVMGCVEVLDSDNAKIVRVSYQEQKAMAREVEASVISEFETNPCLRGSSALRGLFHKGIVVTEGHRDRVFYDEVNKRLQRYDSHKGMEDILFIDSGGGLNMVYKTIEPLRKIGVPAAAIVDFDFITTSDREWDNLIDACQIDKESDRYKEKCKFVRESAKRNEISKQLKKNGYEFSKKLLDEGNKTYFDTLELLKFLDEYGLFVVPIGELENWIPELSNQENRKLKWDKSVFNILQYPSKDHFETDSEFNIWKFIYKLSEWINDPNRKGVD